MKENLYIWKISGILSNIFEKPQHCGKLSEKQLQNFTDFQYKNGFQRKTTVKSECFSVKQQRKVFSFFEKEGFPQAVENYLENFILG